MLHEYTITPREDADERHAYEARSLELHTGAPCTEPVLLRKEGKDLVYGIDADLAAAHNPANR